MSHLDTRFNVIRTIIPSHDLPHYVVEDILKVYPVNVEGTAFQTVIDRFGTTLGSDVVVDFRGFSAIVALAMYEVGGEPSDRKELHRLMK